MIKKVEGIIVSTVDYKENSKILNILTNEDSLIGVFARGSKKLKSSISATSSVMTYGVFHLNYRKESFPTLIEVDVIDSFHTIRKNFLKTNYAVFLLELVTGVYRHGQNKNIYYGA